MRTTTAVILAGGASRRMGEDKRRVRLFPTSPMFLARTVAFGRIAADRVAIVGTTDPSDADPEMMWIEDRWPAEGPLGGLATAFEAFPEDRLVVLACDYPMLQADLVRRLLDRLRGHDASAPVEDTPEARHPLVGCYDAVRCGPIATDLFLRGERSMSSLLDRLDMGWLRVARGAMGAVDRLSLTNVNSQGDLDALRSGAIDRDGQRLG